MIEAEPWTENGCLSWDECEVLNGSFIGEGKCVRYFRHPDVPGDQSCRHCEVAMYFHGWVDTLEGGHIVCPGDWIIKGIKGEFYPCKPDVFQATYEKVEET